MPDLTGRSALVTASSRGIGRAVAELLGADGAAVTVDPSAGEAAAREVVAGIEATGGRAAAVRADVADLAQLHALHDAAQAAHGRLDVVVDHAAIESAPVGASTEEVHDRVFALTARVTSSSLQEAARRVRDGGRITSTSAGGTVSPPGGAAHHGTPRASTPPPRPGRSGTPAPPSTPPCPAPPAPTPFVLAPGTAEQLTATTPLGRLGEPADVADAVAFLAGPDSRWMTGQMVRAAGGLV